MDSQLGTSITHFSCYYYLGNFRVKKIGVFIVQGYVEQRLNFVVQGTRNVQN
jgi:hypothetical protein